MESWKRVWREGIVPLLSRDHLLALEKGLREDDERLIQGATTTPPPLHSMQNYPVDAACAIGYCGWIGDELNKVAEVELFFARACFEIDQNIKDPGGVRWFLNFWDETPRDEVRRLMIPEVVLALEHQKELACS